MILYQTHPEVLPIHHYDTMHIAVLVERELSRMIRVGLLCRIAKFLNRYPISERSMENMLLIEYFPPMKKVNLRSTYRLRTSYRFNVEAAIQIDDTVYTSGIHFTVQDISVTSIGLRIPKKIGKKDNPLLNLPIRDTYDIDIKLEHVKSNEKHHRLNTRLEISRKVMSYHALSGVIGARFVELEPAEQELLFHFIHEAQLYEIRNIKQI